MPEPGYAAKEIASYIKQYVRGTTLGVHLQQYGGEDHIAAAIQTMIEEGHIIGGKVLTGDHDEDGRTVLDWSKLG